ncbi:hypothetical protein [Mesorhizobium sp.]|uniref:hypothetical protein n=1 Tax=Mesorhizobium sp. TaxID=1871066 RepID=UPI000FEA259C|nr:hypothetical protein [Mesorhizobium sp.]RWN38024.1 MAG: hypothetical protein EOR95_02805 [Mesorhizobium sp.]RWP49482.1 MAG: hypothetical protein EOR05_09825 [Mesorhizobium sp.]
MQTKLEKDQEAIGRILEVLLSGGLGRHRFDSYHDGLKVLHMDDLDKATAAFDDVLGWMIDEGLVRAQNVSATLSHGTTYIGVQLTSKGLQALQMKASTDEKSVAETLKDTKGDLAPLAYAKIGALFGGFVGGTIKAIS